TGAGVACRHCVDEPTDVLRQYRFGRHDAVKPAEVTDMVGVCPTLENEYVDESAVKARARSHSGLCVVGLVGGDEVVEVAVEMRHRQHRQHSSDRFMLRGFADVGH